MLYRWKLISIIVFTLLLACSTDSFAQSSSKSLLWKVSRADLQKPSYLFGTIHIICKEDYIWTKAMQKSLDASDKVCFEMDLDDPNLVMTIATGMIDNSGKQLKDYFTPEQYAKLEAYISDSLQMSMAMVQRLRPVALYSLFIKEGNICDDVLSYEQVLSDKAKSTEKEIIGVESAQYQLSLLNKLPTDSVVSDLVDMIDGNSDTLSTQLYNAMYSAYKEQDIDSLSQLIANSDLSGDLNNIFLNDRNLKWVPTMMDMMEQGSIFFAVGVGHLPGESGIINLLIQEGYTVTPIK